LAVQSKAAKESVHQTRFDALKDQWQGQTVCVLASGPSLTIKDVESVRLAKWPTLVTNTTFLLAPWADILFFYDKPWWEYYRKEVSLNFKGQVITKAPVSENNVISTFGFGFNVFNNSGAACINIALHSGAKRVVCLGLDCKTSSANTLHWHGNHPSGLGNALSVFKWFEDFAKLEEMSKENNVEIINASRDTALTCFTRANLEDLL